MRMRMYIPFPLERKQIICSFTTLGHFLRTCAMASLTIDSNTSCCPLLGPSNLAPLFLTYRSRVLKVSFPCSILAPIPLSHDAYRVFTNSARDRSARSMRAAISPNLNVSIPAICAQNNPQAQSSLYGLLHRNLFRR